MVNKRGQLTIFIIVAILIVASVAGYFVFREQLSQEQIPSNFDPVRTAFLSCLEEETEVGISVLSSQGGYIEQPEFESGSSHMPFSSHLDFLGNPIPYWYYVSGNNIERENVPSEEDMEEDLESYIEDNIRNCDLSSYSEQGYEIAMDFPIGDVNIKNDEVVVDLDMELSMNYLENSAVVSDHRVSIASNLGSLYDSAKEIYEYEQEELFLENYALDVLHLYAPVDGVEFNCSPIIWNAEDVFNELEEGIEVNTLSLKNSGNDDYFNVELPVDEEVNFLTSKNWPKTFEVTPSDNAIMMSEPVGNQPGLGIIGFCYVPYHFVYDVKYPVLVQVSEGDETFQFPMAVIISGNNPRKALNGSLESFESSEMCEYKNTELQVNTYDNNYNRVKADVYYECFGERCYIGESPLVANFPQCVNGRIIAKAEGFEDREKIYSVTEEDSVELIMDRLYELDLELKVDSISYDKRAIIYFVSEDNSETVVYPENDKVKLGAGAYNVSVYIYDEASLELDSFSGEQCVQVPRSGIGGALGLTKEECIDIEVPSQVISDVLVGGGESSDYFVDSELSSSSIIELNVESLPDINSLDDLQDNYILFENKPVDIYFK